MKNVVVAIHNPDPEFWQNHIAALRQHTSVCDILISHSAEQLQQNMAKAEVLVSGRLRSDQLRDCKKLQALFVPFSGVNRFPLSELSAKGILVFNSHGAAKYVAERVLALVLALMGRVVRSDAALRTGVWQRTADSSMFWDSLYGKNVAILGTGAIGSNVAQLLNAFDCKVTGFNRSGVAPSSFHNVSTTLDMLRDNEVVIMALPSTLATTSMFNSSNLHTLHNKYVVNVGRANAIEEQSLFQALKNGNITGYASDVHYQYPETIGAEAFPSAYPFHELENVVLTPHTASHTTVARQANVDGAFAALNRWLANDSSLRPVNTQNGY